MKLIGAEAAGRFAGVEVLAFRLVHPRRSDNVLRRRDPAVEAAPGSFVFAPSGIPQRFTVDVEPMRVIGSRPSLFDRPSDLPSRAK